MARRGSLWDAQHQNQSQTFDRLSPDPSSASSRFRRPMDSSLDASKFGQSFAPSSSYLSTHGVPAPGHGHGHGPTRRHSTMPMTTDPAATAAPFGTSFHTAAAEQHSRRTIDTYGDSSHRRRRRHRHRHHDEGPHFSDDEHASPGYAAGRYSNDDSDGSVADEASDFDSDDSDEEPALHGRRHTTAGRHTNTADDFGTSSSRAIPIATPSRRQSYLEDQALSARGDRLGGYFPFHEDPNLRIQRSHPFHSASAKARKQSITLAQSAAAQSIPPNHHQQGHSPNPRRSLAVPKPDRHGSISAAALARRESALGTTPSRLDLSSSISHYGTTPAPPLSSSRLSPASPAIAWRTIRGFDTSKAEGSAMSAFQLPEKNSDGSTPSRYRAEYDDLDPLDPIPTEPRPRPRTQPPPSSSRARAPPPPMPFHYTQQDHDQVDPLARSPSLGKYHPSVYEHRQKLATSGGSANSNDLLLMSSDEDEDPITPMRSIKHQASLGPTDTSAFNRPHAMGLAEPTMRSVSATHGGSVYETSPLAYQNQAYSLPSVAKRLGAGPASPRLDPKGSPGPVTPMDLEAGGTLYGGASAVGGSNPYFERSRGGGKVNRLRY